MTGDEWWLPAPHLLLAREGAAQRVRDPRELRYVVGTRCQATGQAVTLA